MKLRELRLEDAPYMLEWMHDPFVVSDLQTDFGKKTLEDCCRFIEQAKDTSSNIHFAIADDADEYMGTVSLKNITEQSAEFAITVRKTAMGNGYAADAMQQILAYGLEKLHLSNIYWCVSPHNQRAVRFYEKHHYPRVFPERIEDINGYSDEQIHAYIWYQVTACTQ